MATHSVDSVLEIYRRPFADLIFEAARVHRKFHDPNQVQKATLLSIKTGGCPENCSYCPQSAHFKTSVERQPLMELQAVREAAQSAKSDGATRFCMGAAWRQVKDGPEFDRVLDMVREVSSLGMEACVTLGMLTDSQAARLKEAGLTAYNHNLDSSEEFYGKIITTRNYQDRLRTLGNVREAGISVCSGGIIGMGESEADRAGMLATLASFDPQPESVPINALVPVEGTPLAERKPLNPLEFVRTIATARILMPRARVRLSAGRLSLSNEAQALCFLAGANSIFAGDRLLTTPNPEVDQDEELFRQLGIRTEGSAATREHAHDHGHGHAHEATDVVAAAISAII